MELHKIRYSVWQDTIHAGATERAADCRSLIEPCMQYLRAIRGRHPLFVPTAIAAREAIAIRVMVSEMCQVARILPLNEPATFEHPPARRRYGTGSSRMRRLARAAFICISMFQP